ncbi:hypothetical protein BDN67DRAFT_984325 [Paxillus ammoniavirescens]|nr:hypothetical protein BDN67DRAFT_984325 [Paxillus ammoniavirescens]
MSLILWINQQAVQESIGSGRSSHAHCVSVVFNRAATMRCLHDHLIALHYVQVSMSLVNSTDHINILYCSISTLADLSDNNSQHIHACQGVSQHEAELEEALRQAQLQIDAMKEWCRALEEEKRISEANKPRKSAKGVIPDSLSAFDGKIQTITKKFGVMAEMFFPTDNLFSCASPSPPPPFNTQTCYASAWAEEDGILAELDSMLPDHLHTLQTSGHFSELNPQYKAWPPVFFAGGKVDMRWPFSNWKILAQILKVVLWRKSALAHEGIAKCAGLKTNGANWPVNVASTGYIAWAATVQYKHFIIVQWESTHMQEILREINQFVFGHAGVKASMKLATMTQEDLTAEIDAAMAAMDIYPISESVSEQASPLDINIPETEGLQSRSASISHDDLDTPATTLSGVVNLDGDREGGQPDVAAAPRGRPRGRGGRRTANKYLLHKILLSPRNGQCIELQ